MFSRFSTGALALCLSQLVWAIDFNVTVEGSTALAQRAGFRALAGDISANLKAVKRPTSQRLQHIEDSLLKYAESEGFYDARITTQRGQRLQMIVSTGRRYIIKKVHYNFLKSAVFPWNEKRIIRAEQPLVAQDILNEVNQITELLQRDNCYYRVHVNYKVQLDRKLKQAYVSFTQTPSIESVFGESRFIGLKTLPESLIRKRLLWEQGGCYKRALVDKTINQFLVDQLFSDVVIKEREPTAQHPEVDFDIYLKEGKHRTISASVEASTFNPFGVGVGFEHRNLTHHTDIFKVDLLASVREQGITFKYLYPWFNNRDQHFKAELEQHHQVTEAYTETGVEFKSEFERKYHYGLKSSAGVGYHNKRVEDPFNEKWYQLTNLLLALSQSNSYERYPNNWQQMYWGIEFKPYYNLKDSDNQFYKTMLTTKWAYPVSRSWNVAQRIRVGLLDGESLEHVPTHLRYYAGGKGSIRGYGYKEIGTLYDRSKDGGERLFEMSHELTYYFNGNWALRTFADAGNVLPRIGDAPTLYWGAGVGVGYAIGHAMVNFDVAVPITERDKVDKPFQFYLTLAEAG